MKEPVIDNLTPNTLTVRNNNVMHIWAGSLIMLGLFFAFFNQSLAYFMQSLNQNFYLVTYLTVFSGVALCLLLTSILLVGWQLVKKRLSETEIEIYILVSSVLIVPAIAWTIFVTTMWWG